MTIKIRLGIWMGCEIIFWQRFFGLMSVACGYSRHGFRHCEGAEGDRGNLYFTNN